MPELNALDSYRSVGDLLSGLFTHDDSDGKRAWVRDAACLGSDPDLWFPERGGSTVEPKRVCRGCPVREECLEYALTNGEKFGIWGGLSERERRRIRRQRMIDRRLRKNRESAA